MRRDSGPRLTFVALTTVGRGRLEGYVRGMASSQFKGKHARRIESHLRFLVLFSLSICSFVTIVTILHAAIRRISLLELL